MMSPQQEDHLIDILETTEKLINKKYRDGQKKHGGNLFDLTPTQLIDEAIMECIDQITYLLTAKAKLHDYKQRSGLATMAVRTEPELQETPVRSVRDIPPEQGASYTML